jgi:hypothetical protein
MSFEPDIHYHNTFEGCQNTVHFLNSHQTYRLSEINKLVAPHYLVEIQFTAYFLKKHNNLNGFNTLAK